jgi:transcriptional regulator with XRE-family HTH domain/tetratricopeptide (TPR) repeat protein
MTSLPEEPSQRFGMVLRQLRTNVGLSQEDLAEHAGLSVRAIGNLERGRTSRPFGRTIRLLADALGGGQDVLSELLAAASGASPDAPRADLRLVPAQMPAALPDFTGRHELLAGLRETFTGHGDAVTVVAIHGPGGIGKTCVAIQLAHELADAYPDGQLYVNLRGSGPEPLSAADVLTRFIRDMGMDYQILGTDEAELAALYRSAILGRRMLILLDNAADVAQVRPLLPAIGCAVLVTSRIQLADLEGARLVGIGLLSDDDARELFTRIVGTPRATAERAATTRLLDCCQGLPLAVRIAAARLASRPNWTVAHVADRLADERNRLNELRLGDLEVRASFEVSYTALTTRGSPGEVAAKAFDLLGLWEGADISRSAAAALLGWPEHAATAALENLVDASLLESIAVDRYQCHDLLRLYAAERARQRGDQREHELALRRLLTWYVHTANAAIVKIEPARRRAALDQAEPEALGVSPLTFADHKTALGWCDRELANFVTATRQAAAAGLHEHAWRLPALLWRFFLRRSHWAEWIETHQIALTSARVLGNRPVEGWILNYLGFASLQQHRLSDAGNQLRQSLDIAREVSSRNAEARTLSYLGIAAEQQGDLAESARLFHASLAICRDIGDEYAEAFTLSKLGEVLGRDGSSREAIEMVRQSLLIRRQIGDRYGEADSLNQLGALCCNALSPEEAADCLTQALMICREVGDRNGEARTLINLGDVGAHQGDTGAACAWYQQALSIQEAIGDRHGGRLTLDRLAAVGRVDDPD